jgi:hypothetical protein
MMSYLKNGWRRLVYFVSTFWAPIAAGAIAIALGVGNMYVTSDSGADSDRANSDRANCAMATRESVFPRSGAWYGASFDWQKSSVADYSASLGHHPAVTVFFIEFPYDADARADLKEIVDAVRNDGKVLLLTLQPSGGLQTVTPEVARSFAADLAEFNASGVPVIVRFAHEMNGSWYPWGQKPTLYKETFSRLASAVHTAAPGSAMMWAPSYAGGYPFANGQYSPAPETSDFVALDTDRDGRLTRSDDPYAAYYPGDESADWVGMSLYHWGDRFPWSENELAEPNKFTQQLTGTYVGANGDDTVLPDFYAEYGTKRGKPVAIPETAALFNPGAPVGPGALAIKRSWWSQIFDPSLLEEFPLVKMVNWVEWDRYEPEADTQVDWRTMADPAVRTEFVAALPEWLAFGPDTTCGEDAQHP